MDSLVSRVGEEREEQSRNGSVGFCQQRAPRAKQVPIGHEGVDQTDTEQLALGSQDLSVAFCLICVNILRWFYMHKSLPLFVARFQ